MRIIDRYRIYTEDIVVTLGDGRRPVFQLAKEHFESFTVYRAEGAYGGTVEDTAVIEVITAAEPELRLAMIERVRVFVEEIKRVNKQEDVLVTRETVQEFNDLA